MQVLPCPWLDYREGPQRIIVQMNCLTLNLISHPFDEKRLNLSVSQRPGRRVPIVRVCGVSGEHP
jgi:hypothetical protein